MNEAERLAALHAYQILDTGRDEAFDRFTRMAIRLFNTPMALITLVDSDRQWFKSALGTKRTHTTRDEAFCAHALTMSGPLVVEDATLDARFSDNPLVLGEPHVRFYAGAPLRTPGGHTLGTLCAVDTKPRTFNGDQTRLLADLAGAVMTTMELYKALRVLGDMATTDPLTGADNRTRCIETLRATTAECGKDGQPFSLLYVDCDDFKMVNDHHGHQLGDRLLKHIAHTARSLLRAGDSLARIGGDEFALVLPRTDTLGAAAAATRLLNGCMLRVAADGWPVSLSIGAITFLHPPDTPDQALAIADAAMYEAKRSGKGQVHAITLDHPPEQASRSPALGLNAELRRALAEQQLFLEYQPIVSLATGELACVEALLRWRHPRRGVVGPAQFVAFAERTGLILGVGVAVLRLALGQMRAWQRDKVAGMPAKVAVNVSPVQLRDRDFVDELESLIEEFDVPASMLELELTEGALIDDAPGVIAVLERLAALGVSLSIDDFGTGYSSLRYLRDLPIRKLKIDKCFVAQVTHNRRDMVIVTSIVAMARGLGLQTVAEGIETEAQRECLREAGCDFGQGWLFGRPSPATAMDPFADDVSNWAGDAV